MYIFKSEKSAVENNIELFMYKNNSKIPSYKLMPDFHYHEYNELYVNFGETCKIFIGNTTYAVNKHDIALIGKKNYHRTFYKNQKSRHIINIIYSDNIFNTIISEEMRLKVCSFFEKFNGIVRFPKNERICSRLLYEIYPLEKKRHIEGYSERSILNIADVLLNIYSFYKEGKQYYVNEEIKTNLKPVYDVISYINLHYKENITLDMLADKYHINKYYLCHLFKEVTGESVVSFIVSRRLSKAAKLINTTSMSITDIGMEVGFNNSNYFIKCFKNKYEITPYKFRAYWKNKNLNSIPEISDKENKEIN